MDPDEPAKPATAAFGSGGFGFTSQMTSSFSQPTQPSVFGQSSQPAQTTPTFGQATQMSQATFGQLSFGSSTKTSAFGQMSAFGKPAFGQMAIPAFGQSSMPTTSAFSDGNNTGSGGFGSFTLQGHAKFGTTGLGFGAANSSTPSPALMTMDQQASSVM